MSAGYQTKTMHVRGTKQQTVSPERQLSSSAIVVECLALRCWGGGGGSQQAPIVELQEPLLNKTTFKAVLQSIVKVLQEGGVVDQIPEAPWLPRPPRVAAQWPGEEDHGAGALADGLCPRTDIATTVSMLSSFVQKCVGDKSFSAVLHDPELEPLLQHYLLEGRLQLSASAEGQALDTSRWALANIRPRLAAAALTHQRLSVLFVLVGICNALVDKPGSSLVCFFERCRYDETPMRARVADLHRPTSMQLAQERGQPNPLPPVCTDNSPQKLFQCEYMVAALIRTRRGYLLWEFPLVTPIQCLDSGRAECYFAALWRSRPNFDDVSRCFSHTMRLACTEGDAALKKTERAMGKQHPHAGSILHTICQVHAAHNARKNVLALLDNTVSFLLSAAKALRLGASMSKFRKALRAVIREKLRFEPGVPPQQNLDKVTAILDVFVPGHDGRSRLRRSIVQSLITGDVDDERYIVHICPGCCSGYAECLQKFENFLVAALARSPPPMFPRPRWAQQEVAVQWLGLLECLHRLFSHAFLKFSLGCGIQPPNESQDVFASGWSAAIDDSGQDSGALAVEELAGAAVVGNVDLPELAGGVSDEDLWAARRRLHRVECFKVLRGMQGDGPAGSTVLLGLVLGPFVRLVTTMLVLGGEAWENKQLLNAFRQIGGADVKNSRQFRCLMAASGELEGAVISSTSDLLLTPRLWEAVPLRLRAACLRAEAFKVLSRTLVLATDTATQHSLYPWRCFLLLVDDSIADRILSEACLHDACTKAFVEAFGDDLLGPDALAVLRALGILVQVDTSSVEAVHASLRRNLTGRSVQAHLPTFQEGSCRQVLQKYRKVAQRYRHLLDPAATEASSATPSRGGTHHPGPHSAGNRTAEVESPAEPPTAGGGGPWRAFVALACDGRRDFEQLGVQYRALSEEGRAEFERLSALATKQRRVAPDTPFFGASSKDLQRAAAKQRQQNLVAATRSAEASGARVPDSAALAAMSAKLDATSSWDKVLAMKEVAKADNRLRRQVGLSDAAELAKYQHADGAGGLVQAAALQVLRASPPQPEELLPSSGQIPMQHNSTFGHLRWAPTAALQRAKAVAAIPSNRPVGHLVHNQVAELWERLHLTVETGPPLQKEGRASQTQRGKLELCVCAVGRKHVDRMCQELRASLRRIMVKSTSLKAAVLEGEVCVLFVGRQRAGMAAGANDYVADDVAEASVRYHRWAHLAHQQQTPWKSLFHMMDCDKPVVLPIITTDSTIRLASSGASMRDSHLMALLDPHLQWDVVFYRLLKQRIPLGSVVPDSIDVEPLRADLPDPLSAIWGPKQKQSRKRKQPGAWTFDFEVQAEDEGSDADGECAAPDEESADEKSDEEESWC